MPGAATRQAVQNVMQRNRGMAGALAGFLDKGLRGATPDGVWLENFNLDENYHLNMTGRATDSLAILDLTQELKRLPYLSDIRMLEVTEVPGAGVFHFRVIGTLVPPPDAGQG